MLQSFLEFVFKTLTDPDRLIHFLTTVVSGWAGYIVLFAVVFAETGLLVGLFLPGDSFLFTIGVVAGAGDLDIVTICMLLVAASILGDQCGYFLGNRAGVTIFDRPDSRFFKRQYITDTEAFYRRHGGKTLIYAKFVPIIRTFAPFMAGVGRMPYARFLRFNVVGGLAWVILVVIAGFYLGQFALVRRHFEKIVLLVVLVSVLPIVVQLVKNRLDARRTA
jgi:membrane-associated protein